MPLCLGASRRLRSLPLSLTYFSRMSVCWHAQVLPADKPDYSLLELVLGNASADLLGPLDAGPRLCHLGSLGGVKLPEWRAQPLSPDVGMKAVCLLAVRQGSAYSAGVTSR